MPIDEHNFNLEQEILTYYEEELDIFRVYLEDLGYSPFTITNYVYDTKLFLMYLYEHKSQNVALDTISKQDIAGFLRKHHRNASKSSRNRRLMTLRTLYKSLMKSEILSYNPAQEVDMAKQEKGRIPTYLSEEELALLFSGMPASDYYIRNKCMLMLMGLAGLRVVEIHNLNISDIIRNQEDSGIEVSGKGNKARYIPLPLPLYELLLDYERIYRPIPKPNHSNAFFLSKRGLRISRRRIQEVTENAFDFLKQQPGYQYLEQKKLTAHKLRHTFGTGMVRDGTDLVTIQQLMGHTNLNTTQIYTHVSNEQKQKAMRNKDVTRFFNDYNHP
ncbi:tyrosine-type recombinase/integrase [Niallia taxi]|uniref:tyrosine-type recombinase/integrase n=1 Tax=Niallia taxi TaxID=2499688 RepID=UPI00203E81BA|nr:tyrosine-type recombinase/integrase [Niallia taxi]MCM3217788.1 tyrosine-type recombinase/integrase [Niallia taxi]